jgi:hypothetical protein
VEVTVNYIRTRTDGQDEHANLGIVAKALDSPNINLVMCPPAILTGRLQSSGAFVAGSSNALLSDKSAQQVQPKANIAAAKSKITKAKTNTARAKPAAARRKQKK